MATPLNTILNPLSFLTGSLLTRDHAQKNRNHFSSIEPRLTSNSCVGSAHSFQSGDSPKSIDSYKINITASASKVLDTTKSVIKSSVVTTGKLAANLVEYTTHQIINAPELPHFVPGGKNTLLAGACILNMLDGAVAAESTPRHSNTKATNASNQTHSSTTGLPEDTFAIHDDDHQEKLQEKLKAEGRFGCDNKNLISYAKKCDGRDDCLDNSDENKCTQEEFKQNDRFLCSNQKTTPLENKCDHRNDCGDNSDETCTPEEYQAQGSFRCADGTRLPEASYCDASIDCDSSADFVKKAGTVTSSDEDCTAEQFRQRGLNPCELGVGAYHNESRCDGFSQCQFWNSKDVSDEQGCSDEEYKAQGKFKCGNATVADTTNSQCLINELPQDTNCRQIQFVGSDAPCDGFRHCNNNADEECSSEVFEKNGFVRCDNGLTRHISFKCDGKNDCGDNSDEKDCPESTTSDATPANITSSTVSESSTEASTSVVSRDRLQEKYEAMGKFLCTNQHSAIDLESRCNGHVDCQDKSDEHCSFKEFKDKGLFQCHEYSAIPYALRCNGKKNCDFYNANANEEDGCNQEDFAQNGLFHCATGWVISLHQKCDGTNNCYDNSDEEGCNVNDLAERGLNPCSVTGSYTDAQRCDGVGDCKKMNSSDNADEDSCTQAEFKTNSLYFCRDSNKLIALSKRCDGFTDCSEKEDEIGCDPEEHQGNNLFQCHNGDIILSSFQCDGTKDCADGSDEHMCSSPTGKPFFYTPTSSPEFEREFGTEPESHSSATSSTNSESNGGGTPVGWVLAPGIFTVAASLGFGYLVYRDVKRHQKEGEELSCSMVCSSTKNVGITGAKLLGRACFYPLARVSHFFSSRDRGAAPEAGEEMVPMNDRGAENQDDKMVIEGDNV